MTAKIPSPVAVSLGLLLVAALGTTAVFLLLTDWSVGMALLLLPVFLAWALAPFGVLAVTSWQFRGTPRAGWLLLAASLCCVLVQGWVYVSALWLHPDPQSPIVLVVLPAWLLVLAAVAVAAAWFLTRRQPA